MSHLLDDPYLKPYENVLRGRAARAAARAATLTGGRPLAEWATVDRTRGLHRVRGGWVFREWAPRATAMWLVGDFSDWKALPEFALSRVGETDEWEVRLPARALRHGQAYHVLVRWPGGEGERIPSCATYVTQDPATYLFAARVWAPPKAYRWKHPSPAPAATPLVYEAHVGMCTEEEKVASYAEFRETMLPRIKAAGYGTVQLMAVAEHPYYGSFGYHVSSFFAPSSRFGTPDDLKALVDAAHGLGLRVVMDLVHSHAVSNERDGLSLFDGSDCQYFHAGGKGRHPAWGSRCFDYAKDEVVRFLLSNCRYWLEEFHFDGFRFDGVTSMLFWDHGLGRAFGDYSMYFDEGVDEDAWHYLWFANRLIHEMRPDATTIAEDVSGLPGVAAPQADCGIGFDYRMAMGEPDFWFRLAEKVRDDDWPMGGMFGALTDRRADEKVVSYVESHDQALVGGKSFFFQMADKEVYWGMGRDQENLTIERAIALHKMARLATLSLNGGAYLNFMGNEFGHPEWIDFPRAENGWSYQHARRQWSLRDDPRLRFGPLADFDKAMLEDLVASRALFGGAGLRAIPTRLVADEARKVLAYVRGNRLFVFNFNPAQSFEGYGVMVPPATDWQHDFDTDEPRFGGQGRIAPGVVYAPRLVEARGELVQQIQLYLPARTAIVLKGI